MKPVLHLHKMTLQTKLRLMEDLWRELSRRADMVPAPAWHEDVLLARARRIKEGRAKFEDWEHSKRRMREANRNLARKTPRN